MRRNADVKECVPRGVKKFRFSIEEYTDFIKIYRASVTDSQSVQACGPQDNIQKIADAGNLFPKEWNVIPVCYRIRTSDPEYIL